jgi:NadR type nicotinamide-nucleotide adenylyltransferase
MTTGLVLGKFYPPHAGHHFLIDEAKKRVDRLIVLIWWSKVESMSAYTRQKILEEMHPGVRIYTQQCEIEPDYDNPNVWDAHLDLLWNGPDDEQNLRPTYMMQHAHGPWNVGGSPKSNDIDFVFTSEEYGDELARRLGAEHICIDPKRISVPISGTAIRSDPAGNWQHLAEPTRALLTKRFVVTGAESTGTTTLTKSLAQHYNTVWVPEYGRFYTEGSGLLGHEWTADEFIHIVEGQHLAEDFLARKAGPVMFCDTDALSTGVWHERYVWKRSPEVEKLARQYEHYFVTDYMEVEFEDDGLRDGNTEIRRWMQERLIQRINETHPNAGNKMHVLIGGPRMRMAHATDIVDKHVRDGWNLNPPLGE